MPSSAGRISDGSTALRTRVRLNSPRNGPAPSHRSSMVSAQARFLPCIQPGTPMTQTTEPEPTGNMEHQLASQPHPKPTLTASCSTAIQPLPQDGKISLHNFSHPNTRNMPILLSITTSCNEPGRNKNRSIYCNIE